MSRSESRSRLISRLAVVLWLVSITALPVAALLWLDRPIVTAEVVESSVESTTDDSFMGYVEWTDEDGTTARRVELTSEQVEAGTVSLMVELDGQVQVVDPAEETGPSGTVLVVAALVGLALAVVVLATLRGFGYVRGTGRYGEMDSDDVKESHAFYWRH